MFKKIIFFIILFIVCFQNQVFAVTAFTPEYRSPRTIAMGGAYVAVADDANSVFLNPAGLGNALKNDLSASYVDLFPGENQKTIVGSIGLDEFGRVGFGYNVLAVGFAMKDLSENPVQVNFANGDMAISYGYQINKQFLVGAKVSRSFTEFSSSDGLSSAGAAYGVSLGLMIKPIPVLSAGLLLENAYATDFLYENSHSEKMPKNAVLGFSYQPLQDKVLLALDLRSDDLEHDTDIDSASIGGEISLIDNLKLRLGYLLENSSSAYVETGSAGLGVVMLDNLTFDYAYRKWGTRLEQHFFSMGAVI
ncbi:MAG: PorV/PorQ family protein [bacterium]